jgi:hypothetical protein
MDEAAARRIAREKLWEWACLAIARDELPVSLPDNVSLDARVLGGGETWRHHFVRSAALAAERGNDLARYQWTRAITLDPRTFRKWLNGVQGALALPVRPPSRRRKSRASRLEAALQALAALYPTKPPLESIKAITAEINRWLVKQNVHGVSPDTTSRALKRFKRRQQQN